LLARFACRVTKKMSNDNPLTDLTDRIRGWFGRSPKAQQAYRKLSADLDTVVERVDAATTGLRERVAPIIDPSRPEPTPEPIHDPASEPGLTPAEQAALEASQSGAPAESGGADPASDPVIPASESSVPPGVKKDGEPVDPTT
jgi:hypothetical protein